MADLVGISAPLGAECAPDDTVAEVLDDLRAQHPVPLVVVDDGALVGTLSLDSVVAALDDGIERSLVRDHMRPAPSADSGATPLHGATEMVRAQSAALIVTEPDG